MDRKDYFVGQFEDFMFEVEADKGDTQRKRKDKKEE